MEDIIVFGHGKNYKSKEESIKKKYHVIAFIDNAVAENAEMSDSGIPIYNPREISDLPMVPIFVISVHFFQMAEQLIRLGVDDNRIRFGTAIEPYYDNVENAFHDLDYEFVVEDKKITLIGSRKKYIFQEEREYKEVLRKIMAERDPYIRWIKDMPLKPLSGRFGLEYGKAADRYYIEKFLKENKKYITGDVMEIAESTYTYMFGENVKHAYALHVNGWGENCIKGNLETGEGIVENSMDCLVCTQTLECIFDIQKTIQSIYKLLKKGGTALITTGGLKQLSLYDYYNWGEYWSMTGQSLERMLAEVFGEENVEVNTYGNIKIAFALLYGICIEELREEDFEYFDEQYPVIITAKVKKE